MFHLKCVTVFWIRLCLDNCSVTCTVTIRYSVPYASDIFWHVQNSIYSGIFRHIQRYLALLGHIHAYRGIVKAYLGLFKYIQHHLKPLHIHKLAIFRALACLKLQAYSKPCETLIRHIQNPAIVTTVRTVYSGNIQPYSATFRTLCKAHICRSLVYLESWNIQNPYIVTSQQICRRLLYLRK